MMQLLKDSEEVKAISIGEMAIMLAGAYCKYIEKSTPFKQFPAVMLWGAPGVGKSQGVIELAKILENNTGKKVVITDVRLLLFNPVDLRGIPTSNIEKTMAIWLKPKIFQMSEDSDIVNILFLDEITSAPQSVQAAAYQITLDRMIGEHKLPDNCFVICAGNRLNDRSVSIKMPRALANRLCHFTISVDFASWQAWAIEHGINEKVLCFLTAHQDNLIDDEIGDDTLAYATPRSWEMVSNILNNVDDNIDNCYSLICGIVGVKAAVELLEYERIYKNVPNIDDIFAGKEVAVPKDIDTLFATTTLIYKRACKRFDENNAISNSIEYALKLPIEFSVLLFKEYIAISKDAKLKLLSISNFHKWTEKCGKYL